MKKITIDELRRLHYTEGLILQGCGGDLKEWVSGIQKLFTDKGILLDGDEFKDIYVFEHDGLVNLLFSLERVKIDLSKLTLWRLYSHDSFGGTWLSDYVNNKLGGFIIEETKPNCSFIGQDGNIFNLMNIAAQTLKENGLGEKAKEMKERVLESSSYDEGLNIIGDYVNFNSSYDENDLDQDEDFGISIT